MQTGFPRRYIYQVHNWIFAPGIKHEIGILLTEFDAATATCRSGLPQRLLSRCGMYSQRKEKTRM